MKNYRIGLYEKAIPNNFTIKEKLEIAKKANYDYLEMTIDATEEKIDRINMSKHKRCEIIKAMLETGMPIDSVSVSALTKYALGDLDDVNSMRGMEILEGAIILAKDLGIRVIMIPGYDIYFGDSTKETEAKFIKNINIAVEYASKYGVILAFETMENEFMNTTKKAKKYIDMINSPFLQIYPDAGNVTNAVTMYNENIVDDFKTGEGHIVAVHLKETVPGKFREIPFGTGHVNFKEVIHTAYAIGVRRYVTEFWYIGSENWMEDLNKANSMMCNLLDKEG